MGSGQSIRRAVGRIWLGRLLKMEWGGCGDCTLLRYYVFLENLVEILQRVRFYG